MGYKIAPLDEELCTKNSLLSTSWTAVPESQKRVLRQLLRCLNASEAELCLFMKNRGSQRFAPNLPVSAINFRILASAAGMKPGHI